MFDLFHPIYMYANPTQQSLNAAPQVHVVVYLASAHTSPQQGKGTEQRKHLQQQSEYGHSRKSIQKEDLLGLCQALLYQIGCFLHIV